MLVLESEPVAWSFRHESVLLTPPCCLPRLRTPSLQSDGLEGLGELTTPHSLSSSDVNRNRLYERRGAEVLLKAVSTHALRETRSCLA